MSEKEKVKLFISYAHGDKEEVTELMMLLKLNFKLSKLFDYEIWQDGELLLGDKFHTEITAAAEHCDFGLLMTSLSFLNSQYINDYELPPLVSNDKALPIAINRVDFQRHDLKGLEEYQFFGHEKCFSRCTTKLEQEDFAHELFCQIEDKISKIKQQSSKAETPQTFRKQNNPKEEVNSGKF